MHFRKRHIDPLLKKRRKIFPVVGIIGPRQVGKTTFLLHECRESSATQYVTLDRHEYASRAKRSPEDFLLSETQDLKKQLIIDEVQKVPILFDSIKSLIDERRRVGLFTISGSVEFSDKAGVRESLAGRMGICRLYPLTLAELSHQPLRSPWVDGFEKASWRRTPHEIHTWLQRGGMPIFCSLNNPSERESSIESWLEALCYRDLQQLKGGKFQGDIALACLKHVARHSRVNVSKLAQEIDVSRATVNSHLAGLEALFILYRLPSFVNRSSAPEYVIFDAAVLRHFLTDLEEPVAQLQTIKTLLINEILAQHEYRGERRPELFSYHRPGGSELDLVLRNRRRTIGIEISLKSDLAPYALRGIKSFLAAHPKAEGFVLAPVTQFHQIGDLRVIPWTRIG